MNAALEVFGMSVPAVARLLGVSVSHVYRLWSTDETFPEPRKLGPATHYETRKMRKWCTNHRMASPQRETTINLRLRGDGEI
jgi:predicted DNA-binding transcriptional regulator AlpA